jgi:signal transduction histidine kinase
MKCYNDFMESFVQADIFFLVTTIAVIILTACVIVIFVYAIKIIRDVRYISKKVKEESDKIITDVQDIRETIKTNITDRIKEKSSTVIDIVMGGLKLLAGRKSRSKKKE